MKLRTLHLENFRSYEKLELGLSDAPATILHGPNATGKTNILEAMATLALAHSPMAAEESNLFHWGDGHYRISSELQKDAGERLTLELVSQVAPRKAKMFTVNGVKTPLARYLGRLPIVLFLPSDLDLFTGSPDRRRRFLDDLLTQVSLPYRVALDEYRRVIRQRNALLKRLFSRRGTSSEERGTGERELAPWDEKAAILGAQIIVARQQLVATLNMSLREELLKFGEEVEVARMEYRHHGSTTTQTCHAEETSSSLRSNWSWSSRSTVPLRGTTLRQAQCDRGMEALKQSLLSELQHVHERDIILQATTIGPHRDDWSLLVDGKNVVTFASRGQQRSAVLALLLLQATYLELTTGERPLLLLDDVFSELDEAHEAAVLTACARYQAFITATHLPEGLPGGVQVLRCPLAHRFSSSDPAPESSTLGAGQSRGASRRLLRSRSKRAHQPSLS